MQKERSEILHTTLKDELVEYDIYAEGNSGDLMTFLKAKQKNKRIDTQKVTIRKDGLDFGISRILLYFGIIIFLTIILQTIIYFLSSQKASQVSNMIKVYTNSVDHWIAFAEIYTIIFEILVWNGKAKVWEKDPLDVYTQIKNRIESEILTNFEKASEDYNLGNYTKYYRAQVRDVIK